MNERMNTAEFRATVQQRATLATLRDNMQRNRNATHERRNIRDHVHSSETHGHVHTVQPEHMNAATLHELTHDSFMPRRTPDSLTHSSESRGSFDTVH